MACYHPKIAFPIEKNDNGKWLFKPLLCVNEWFDSDWVKNFDAKTWQNPLWQYEEGKPDPVIIPCKKCLGCKLDYSRQWADRMILELDSSKKAVFVTLTYDNEHVPVVFDDETGELICFSLFKEDVQLFMKRLRSRKKFEDRVIRFYLSGEYGSTTHRPHYHAIIFGIGLDDFQDLKPKGMNELKQKYFISKEFAEIWQNGFCLLCDVSWNTCAYVSRYVMKKVFNDLSMEAFGAEPEFSLMSRNPGIAGCFADNYKLDPDVTFVSVRCCDKKIPVPKYVYDRIFGESGLNNSELYCKIKEQRKSMMTDKRLLELQKTELSEIEYLEMKEEERFVKTKSLTDVGRMLEKFQSSEFCDPVKSRLIDTMRDENKQISSK